MEDSDTMGYDGGRDDKNDIHSTAVRAGKRTYFFDVKATRNDDYYITITESKRRQGEEASYEKHKIFLYREDFNKFKTGLGEAIDYVIDHKGEVEPREEDDDQEGFLPFDSRLYSNVRNSYGGCGRFFCAFLRRFMRTLGESFKLKQA